MLLAAGLCAGCSDEGGETRPDASPTVGVFGTVFKFDFSNQGTPVDSAAVCVSGRDDVPCATTDSVGAFALPGVPAQARTSLVFSKPGFLSTTAPLEAKDRDLSVMAGIVSESAAEELVTSAGGQWPLGEAGMVAFVASLDTPFEWLAGVRASLAFPPGSGPIYLSEQGPPDPALANTSATGVGFFTDVAPGEFELTFSHDAASCSEFITGWPSSTPQSAGGLLLGGQVTLIRVLCTSP